VQNKGSAVLEVLAAALWWFLGFAVLSFVVGVLTEGSFEVAFRQWRFSAWQGAMTFAAASLLFGLFVTLTKRWRDHRREKKKLRRTQPD
jgi:uncharacterized integral membrane protein